MPEFHIGDTVEVSSENAEGKFPIVFEVTGLHKDPVGKLLYTGQGQPWWPEDRLDYWLNEEQKKSQQDYERVIHTLCNAVCYAKECVDQSTWKAMPEWFKKWYVRELGKYLGWDAQLKP